MSRRGVGLRPPRRGAAVAGLLLLLFACAATGHQLRYNVTELVWNDRTASLEVTHRLHLHEALSALTAAYGVVNADPEALRTRAQVLLYVSERFQLRDASGRTIPLDPVGAELDGLYVLVYQEARLAAPPAAIVVESSVMTELWDDQRNHVNYELGEAVDTVVLDGATPRGRLSPGGGA